MQHKKIIQTLLFVCLTGLGIQTSAQIPVYENRAVSENSTVNYYSPIQNVNRIPVIQSGSLFNPNLFKPQSTYTDPDYRKARQRNIRPQTQTLFSSDIRHGGYGSLVYGITSINGEVTYMRGTRGAWIIHFAENHALQIGLAGYRTHSEFRAVNWDQDSVGEPELRTNYGGFEIEYVNRSYKLVHFGTQLLIGSGNVRYDDRDLAVDKTRDSYFVMQPGANMHLNVTTWFRVSAGVFYRHAANVNLEGTSDRDLSGITGLLGLRFGRF